MSFPTQQAYVHYGDWNATSDSHPAMAWMHEYADAFEEGPLPEVLKKYHAQDFVFTKSTGEKFPAGQASYDAVIENYSLMTKYHHEPYFLVCWEKGNGDFEMIGSATVYANLPGDGSGPKNVTDNKGRKWEVKVPGSFQFVYKKDGNSFKLGSTIITSDSGPIMVELLKRGVVKPADIGL